MRIYLPWMGEFGSELLKWVPLIYADKEDKIVFHEEGKDCLYPYKNTVAIKRIKEEQRKCAGSLNQDEIFENIKNNYGDTHKYITPSTTGNAQTLEVFEPSVSLPYNLSCDIAVFPRWRHNTERKNWTRWPEFVDLLKSNGFKVFACGHPDSSYKINCPCAGDYDNPLEASIHAIKNSTLRIGCNTALNILSLYCGKQPWMIITEKGMSCNIGKDGVNYNYYWFADHKKVGWKVFPFYNEPERMLPFICENIES